MTSMRRRVSVAEIPTTPVSEPCSAGSRARPSRLVSKRPTRGSTTSCRRRSTPRGRLLRLGDTPHALPLRLPVSLISVVLYGRNDSHGYNLHRRAALSLNCLAEVL